MSLFNSDKSDILQEPSWLQPLSDPPSGRLLCRDADSKLMARHLANLFITRKTETYSFHGPPGTGKTACVRYLLSEVARHAYEQTFPSKLST
jgi:Cdc6-like AAA superfamily ATPase